MNGIHRNAANEIQAMASGKIKQMLCEISLVVRLAISQVAESYGASREGQCCGEHGALSKYVAAQFLDFANDFEREMTAELKSRVVEQILSDLSDLDGPLSNRSTNEKCETKHSGANGRVPVEAMPAANRQKPDPRQTVKQEEAKTFAAVSQQRVIRFLQRQGFEYVPTKTGELTYRDRPTGKKVSIPKHRCDIAPPTVRSILRRVGDILNKEVRIVKGDLMVVERNRRQSSNGKQELKGGLD